MKIVHVANRPENGRSMIGDLGFFPLGEGKRGHENGHDTIQSICRVAWRGISLAGKGRIVISIRPVFAHRVQPVVSFSFRTFGDRQVRRKVLSSGLG